MKDTEIDFLLYSIPDNVDYTDIAEELDIQDVKQDRINKLTYMLENKDEYRFIQVFRAAGLLCHWGIDKGFLHMSCILFSDKENNILSDNDYEYMLSAFQYYRASQADMGHEKEARVKIYPCVKEIIDRAKSMSFSISRFYHLIWNGYYEYIPLVKDYLSFLLNKKEVNYWNIYDCASLLIKLDRVFVEEIFQENNKRLSDFNLG